MTDEEREVTRLVEQAVQQSWRQWAGQHPFLAEVIQEIRLRDKAVESLRLSAEYRAAVDAYHRQRNELELLGRLSELAAGVLQRIIGG